jgi:Zn finger protein HypA/HybF involved in hydrogenase expression
MTVLREGVVGGALNLYFIYKFMRILTTPFASTDAFKLGIIDEKGKILKKHKKLKTIEEKEAYTLMHRLVWKMKRLMEKIPFGKSRLASYAAALWLIKEEKNFKGTDQELQESFLTFLESDWKEDAMILKENYEGDMDKKSFSNLRQEGIDIKKASMSDVIKDFQSSDAPQFKGKSDKKKKEMAIAAKLSKEEVETEASAYRDAMQKDSKKKAYKKKYGKMPFQFTNKTRDSRGVKAEEHEPCPKCDGAGCEHCDGKGFHVHEMPNRKNMEKINTLLKDYHGKFKWRDEVLYVTKEIEKDVRDIISKDKGHSYMVKVSKNPMREEVEINEVLVMGKAPKTMKDNEKLKWFDKLKSGQTIQLWYDSSVAKGTKWREFQVGRKTKSKKFNLEKVSMQMMRDGKPGGVKWFLYNRQGNISLAWGDMAVSLISMKEELEEARRMPKNVRDYMKFAKGQGPNPDQVLDVKDVDKWVKEIKKGIKAGWVSVASSNLGGDENVAILIKLTLEKENDWPHKILHNASFGMIRIDVDGGMEMFASGHKVKNMRKTSVKSARDVVSKINTWIKKVDEEVLEDGTDKMANRYREDTPGQIEEAMKSKVADAGMECMECGKKFRAKLSTLEYGKTKCPKCKSTDIDFAFGESVTLSFSEFITEGRPKQDKDFVPGATVRDLNRTGLRALADAQKKKYSSQDIQSIARKYKQRVADVVGGKTWDWEWIITLTNGMQLTYDYGLNSTFIKGWKFDKKKAAAHLAKYGNEHETVRDMQGGGGKVQVTGLETAFELISEGWISGTYSVTKDGEELATFDFNPAGEPDANGIGTTKVTDDGDFPKEIQDLFKTHSNLKLKLVQAGSTFVKEEAPANSVAGGNVNLDPFVKKKRKNAKVQTEMFGGQKVFVVSPDRYFQSRLGKSRYARYEKYVGNDKLGEAIRQYGRNNPKNSIILKNSGNGAMLYLKYGRQ